MEEETKVAEDNIKQICDSDTFKEKVIELIDLYMEDIVRKAEEKNKSRIPEYKDEKAPELIKHFPHIKSKSAQAANVSFPDNITIKSEIPQNLTGKENLVDQFEQMSNLDIWDALKNILKERNDVNKKIQEEIQAAKTESLTLVTQLKSDAINALDRNFKTTIDNVGMFVNFDEISKSLTANTNSQFEKIDMQLNNLSQILQNELMIIKRVLWNNSIVTNSSSKDLKLTKCMNYDLPIESGWANCKYLNCNHIGPGDFITVLLEKLEIKSTEPYDRILNIKACAFHENMIQVNHQFTVLSKTTIYQEYTSYLTLTRATGDITRSNFHKLALSMIPSTLNRISLYQQLVKDLFCTLTFPTGTESINIIPNVEAFNELLTTTEYSGKTAKLELKVETTDDVELYIEVTGSKPKPYDKIFKRHFKYFKDSSIFKVIYPNEDVKNKSNTDFIKLVSKTLI